MNTSPLIFTVIADLLGYSLRCVKRFFQLFRLILLLLVLGFGVFCAFSWWITQNSSLSKAAVDVNLPESIVVFAGDRGRVTNGLTLLNTTPPSTSLLISGGYRKKSFHSQGHHRIDIECGARNTYENALETRAWMESQQVVSAFIVTSDYHLLRSLLQLYLYAPGFHFIPVGVSTPSLRRYLLLCAQEYIKCIGIVIVWSASSAYRYMDSIVSF